VVILTSMKKQDIDKTFFSTRISQHFYFGGGLL
jgi:hypothetical protein